MTLVHAKNSLAEVTAELQNLQYQNLQTETNGDHQIKIQNKIDEIQKSMNKNQSLEISSNIDDADVNFKGHADKIKAKSHVSKNTNNRYEAFDDDEDPEDYPFKEDKSGEDTPIEEDDENISS